MEMNPQEQFWTQGDIVKFERHERVGDMWQWLQSALPRSLQAKQIAQGYGYVQCIYRSGYRRRLIEYTFDALGTIVATVNGTTIELYAPEYFSDFDKLGREYEAQTGYEVTLKYWQSPSKKCA